MERRRKDIYTNTTCKTRIMDKETKEAIESLKWRVTQLEAKLSIQKERDFTAEQEKMRNVANQTNIAEKLAGL